MLMGDFSYPDIDWDHRQCSSYASEETSLFLESIESNYIKQHVYSVLLAITPYTGLDFHRGRRYDRPR